jgi:hypothetical protein
LSGPLPLLVMSFMSTIAVEWPVSGGLARYAIRRLATRISPTVYKDSNPASVLGGLSQCRWSNLPRCQTTSVFKLFDLFYRGDAIENPSL